MKRHSLKRGYSIVEILVVVAIIMVLAAIISSAVLAGLRSGKISFCANNLSQIQRGLTLYLNDNNGDFPLDALNDSLIAYKPGSMPPSYYKPSSIFYVQDMKVYGLTKDIYKCPLDPYYGNPLKAPDGNLIGEDSQTRYVSSYVSSWLAYRFPFHQQVISESQIPNPSECWTFVDIFLPKHQYWYMHEVLRSGHGKDANYAFLDGHVKSLPCSYRFTHKGVTMGGFPPPGSGK